MIATTAVGFVILGVLCLTLAVRALRGQTLSFENKAAMAVAWVLIIGVLAFVIGRLFA
jgi:hypothetical protein